MTRPSSPDPPRSIDNPSAPGRTRRERSAVNTTPEPGAESRRALRPYLAQPPVGADRPAPPPGVQGYGGPAQPMPPQPMPPQTMPPRRAASAGRAGRRRVAPAEPSCRRARPAGRSRAPVPADAGAPGGDAGVRGGRSCGSPVDTHRAPAATRRPTSRVGLAAVAQEGDIDLDAALRAMIEMRRLRPAPDLRRPADDPPRRRPAAARGLPGDVRRRAAAHAVRGPLPEAARDVRGPSSSWTSPTRCAGCPGSA